MHPRDLIGGLDSARQQATKAALSAVSLARPAVGLAGLGLGFVKRHATTMVPTCEGTAKATLSAVSLVKPVAGVAGSGLGFVKCHATAMVSTREGPAKTAAVVVGAAVGAYFLWPAAATAGAVMKAPGATGFLISRTVFVANPQLYFQILRTAGAGAAAAFM